MAKLDRITIEPGKMNGQPCIRGDANHGPSRPALDREELRRAYPDLEDEDIRQALKYAAANLDDRVEELVAL